MPLIIDAALTEPPSEITCFRDVTLYAACFIGKRIVLECKDDMKDIYWKWLKQYGAFDYVDDIIEPFSESDISIRAKRGNITVPSIDSTSLGFILQRLEQLRYLR
jgi:hypothetical protein